MSDIKTLQINSHSAEATEKIGQQLGNNLIGGECIELISDLGGGKTTLVRGLALGIGSDDRVASPTFMISRQYQGKKFKLLHFDFYRLNEAGLIAHEIEEVKDEPNTVIVVEWGDVVSNVLPSVRLKIKIQLAAGNEEERVILVNYPEQLTYLVECLSC